MRTPRTPTINLPHQYLKLRGQVRAKLVDVELLSRKDLNFEYKEVDTIYTEDGETTKYSDLPRGLVLILTFIGHKRIPFTVSLPGRASSKNRYQSTIGHWYNVEIRGIPVKSQLQEALPLPTPAMEEAEKVMGI